MSNIVFIATSLDGYIADEQGGIDWLHAIPDPEKTDMGFDSLMTRIDGLVMGRNTFEKVLSFGIDWPYSKPVFLLSTSLTSVPSGYEDKVTIVNGSINEIVTRLNADGYKQLYIDGGKTIQSFLNSDLIDEMVITTVPLLIGGGIPLFGSLASPLEFRCKSSTAYNNGFTQSHFVRYRE